MYKPPLGPEDEPEVLQRIRTLPKQRKRFEQKLIESGGSLKRVRIDNAVLVQETEKYIQSLDDNNNDVGDFVSDTNEQIDIESLADEELEEEEVQPQKATVGEDGEETSADSAKSPLKRRKSFRKGLRKLNPTRLLKRAPKAKLNEETKTIVITETTIVASEDPSKSKSKILCHPIVVKLRELARRQIRRSPSKKTSDSLLKTTAMSDERQQILQLRESPKAGGREISAYIERHESDEVVEVLQLEESPGEVKRRKEKGTHVQPDEIIHFQESGAPRREEEAKKILTEVPDDVVEPTISELLEEELRNEASALPPKKVARRQKEHYYEDIDDDDDPNEHLNFTLMTPEMMNSTHDVVNIDLTLIGASGELMKSSLANQDNQLLHEMADREKRLSDMFVSQSSGEDEDHPVKVVDDASAPSLARSFLLAPISSVDSASSEDERKVPLTPVAEESDRESVQVLSPDGTDDPLILSTTLYIDEREEDVITKTSQDQTVSMPLPVSESEDSREAEANALVSSVLETAVHFVNDRWKGMRCVQVCVC